MLWITGTAQHNWPRLSSLIVLVFIATWCGRDQVWPISGCTYRLGSLGTSVEVLQKKSARYFSHLLLLRYRGQTWNLSRRNKKQLWSPYQTEQSGTWVEKWPGTIAEVDEKLICRCASPAADTAATPTDIDRWGRRKGGRTEKQNNQNPDCHIRTVTDGWFLENMSPLVELIWRTLSFLAPTKKKKKVPVNFTRGALESCWIFII